MITIPVEARLNGCRFVGLYTPPQLGAQILFMDRDKSSTHSKLGFLLQRSAVVRHEVAVQICHEMQHATMRVLSTYNEA